ncbi:ADP-ribose diphosphatase [Shewanella cyperi]|uniref:ADP-ribose diphosphatase n=1 Tax=Shewanella cyperi TaxID=2814292 RepID=UPI001A946D2D|nr:ADP-ribose diphosphatase [Shewanella cyperi]QSX40272.1 ADP-ribose diphosphatase [Shewanella cyperi]
MIKRFFGREDVEVLGERTAFKGFFTLKEYRFRHRLFAGGWSQEVTREVFECGHAVVVLPYDPRRDQLVLIEQIRFPAVETSNNPWLLELVAGMIDAGESPEQVAERELLEEAGLDALSMHKVGSYLASPGGTSERFYFYWAEVDASKACGIHGLAEEHEDIRVHVLDREEAYNLVIQGQIENASTLIGLQWLQLNHEKLRRTSE